MLVFTMPQPTTPQPTPPKNAVAEAVVVDARQLFQQGAREVWIEHDGARYRLRITRRNKLILQK
jgi:hemin uptake protein HemP